jgi:hypothetical protein
MAVRKLDIDYDAQNEARYLVVLLASNTIEIRDTIHEEANIMVRGKTAATGIDFCFAADLFQPRDEVLDDSLIELVKNVRGDGAKDIGVG